MPISEASPMLQEVADLCELCRVRCERAFAGGELVAMGPVVLAAASMSRLCADTLDRCSGMAADVAMVRMSVKAMCGEAARLLSTCARACRAADGEDLRDLAVLLTRCADLCALLAGPPKITQVPVAAVAALPAQTRHLRTFSRGSAGVA
ncbi:hypothetical protein VSH64_47010 [Amycolatopsis rhabdoformis]|uniref:Four-helix bundle copper-binding protein n=1 Tax=Amycolatopsis rhabdoformis TaxID=1448059 RepID=A0ABZ1I9H9_9PSEU|nr:hypothetical protein [Amycolatopsis rhabdoformis]WSE30263.1 hypothetical protein VSH64_47010 [Amycolatopsis rhabdoformis]